MASSKKTKIDWYLLTFAWVVAMTATIGSLFFSEEMGFVPCQLCWYQRIAMYPTAVVLLMGVLLNDLRAGLYGMVLAGIGLVIAIYHNFIQWEIIPPSMIPCSQGVPCGTMYIQWLGFITIPFLSMMAFGAIFIVLCFLRRSHVK